MPAKQYVEVEGQRLALSNLDKVLYPGSGFTKGEVIDYYIRVSRWLLPHFADRPVTMLRFPDGVHGLHVRSFFPHFLHGERLF
jgi:bifunctional non-homologous end joining protein LigD